ncbi:hypothetical protein OQA88_11786 [Cercophora sp. LCS_1]
MSRYPVCRTAELSSSVIDCFLSQAYDTNDDLAPGSDHTLLVVSVDNDLESGAVASPGQILSPSPFIGQSIQEVADHLGPAVTLFIVLDEQSSREETAVLVSREGGNDGNVDRVQMVRIAFGPAQILPKALELRGQHAAKGWECASLDVE